MKCVISGLTEEILPIFFIYIIIFFIRVLQTVYSIIISLIFLKVIEIDQHLFFSIIFDLSERLNDREN